MSRATKCDVCKRTTPDINPRYSRKQSWRWYVFNWDSQGGSDFQLDLCEDCWNGFELFMKEKLGDKDNELNYKRKVSDGWKSQ